MYLTIEGIRDTIKVISFMSHTKRDSKSMDQVGGANSSRSISMYHADLSCHDTSTPD